jgi:hypothetical protein
VEIVREERAARTTYDMDYKPVVKVARARLVM